MIKLNTYCCDLGIGYASLSELLGNSAQLGMCIKYVGLFSKEEFSF